MIDPEDVSVETEQEEMAADLEAEESAAPEPDAEPSMEALLDQQDSFRERLEKREVVWVKVVHVQTDNVHVDIGEKQDGRIPASEFGPEAPPKPGARIPVVLVGRGRGEDHPALLSCKKARFHLGWDRALKAFSEKSRVRGTVVSAVKGGFTVDVSGVPAFMPSSLADLRPVRKPQAMSGMGVRCYIIEVNKEKKQLVLSRKAVLEEEAKKRRDQFLAKVKAGNVFIGRVSHVAASGAFVWLGGAEGFVPTSELAWKDPEKAKEGLVRNQKLKVKILKIESETGKVTLGVKQFLPNPADALRKKYPPKASLKGKVIEVRPDGVRMELGPQTTAFCPLAELPWKSAPPAAGKEYDLSRGSRRMFPPGGEGRGRGGFQKAPEVSSDQVIWPAAGDSVRMIALGVNPATFEVTVSIRRFEEMEDRKRVAQYLKGTPPPTLGQIFARGDRS